MTDTFFTRSGSSPGSPEVEKLEMLCSRYGLPVVDLNAFNPQAEAISLIPVTFARQWKLLPLSRVGSTLTVCVANPLALHAIDGARFATGLRTEVVVAPAEAIEAAIPRFYGGEIEMAKSQEPQYTPEAEKTFKVKTEALTAAACRTSHIQRAPARRSAHTQTCWYVGDIASPLTAEQLIEQALEKPKENKKGAGA